MRLLIGIGALAVLLVGGCSAPAEVPVTDLPPAVAPVADPAAVVIPKLDVRSDLIRLGVEANGELQVPSVDTPEVAGWYAGAKVAEDGDETKPGQRGSAVIAAHVDGHGPEGQKGWPGLFNKLSTLVPGDSVIVEQKGGGSLRFIVESVESFNKDQFPTERVYLADDATRLNLVTCGGPFDEGSGHYVDNVVAFTRLEP